MLDLGAETVVSDDLAKRIVEALFDLSSEQGGLIKSQCVQRVREIIAFDQVNQRTDTTLPRWPLVQPERTNLLEQTDGVGTIQAGKLRCCAPFVVQPNPLFNRFAGTVIPTGQANT